MPPWQPGKHQHQWTQQNRGRLPLSSYLVPVRLPRVTWARCILRVYMLALPFKVWKAEKESDFKQQLKRLALSSLTFLQEQKIVQIVSFGIRLLLLMVFSLQKKIISHFGNASWQYSLGTVNRHLQDPAWPGCRERSRAWEKIGLFKAVIWKLESHQIGSKWSMLGPACEGGMKWG